jgi:hypothetical protein
MTATTRLSQRLKKISIPRDKDLTIGMMTSYQRMIDVINMEMPNSIGSDFLANSDIVEWLLHCTKGEASEKEKLVWSKVVSEDYFLIEGIDTASVLFSMARLAEEF